MSLTTNLVLCYPFNNNGNDAHGSNHLTDVGSVAYVAGKLNEAASFNGSSNYFELAHNSDIAHGDFDFEWSGWVRLTTSANQVFIGKDASGQRTFALSFNQVASAKIGVTIYGSGGAGTGSVAVSAADAITLNTWYHWRWWHNAAANTLNIQINNGTVYSVDTLGLIPGPGTAPLNFGRRAFVGAHAYSAAQLDQVNFWKRLLTTDERSREYNGGAGLAYADYDPPPVPTLSVASTRGTLTDGATDAAGAVAYGSTETYTLSNTGGAMLTFGATSVGTGVTLVSGPANGATLAAGANTTLVVRYTLVGGDVSGTISIASDDTDTPFNWTLTATVADPEYLISDTTLSPDHIRFEGRWTRGAAYVLHNGGRDGSITFRGNPTEIKIRAYTAEVGMRVLQDDVLLPGSRADYYEDPTPAEVVVSIKAGLDGLLHKYELPITGPGVGQIKSLILVGGTLATDEVLPRRRLIAGWGDSILHGWSGSISADYDSSNGILLKTAAMLGMAAFNGAENGSTVKYRGNDDTELANLLSTSRIAGGATELTPPDYILILYGTNDMDGIGGAQTPEQHYTHFLDMLMKISLAYPDAILLVIGILPRNDYAESYIDTWRAVQIAAVAQIPNAQYIDPKPWALQNNWDLYFLDESELYLHLKPFGSTFVAEQVRDYILLLENPQAVIRNSYSNQSLHRRLIRANR